MARCNDAVGTQGCAYQIISSLSCSFAAELVKPADFRDISMPPEMDYWIRCSSQGLRPSFPKLLAWWSLVGGPWEEQLVSWLHLKCPVPAFAPPLRLTPDPKPDQARGKTSIDFAGLQIRTWDGDCGDQEGATPGLWRNCTPHFRYKWGKCWKVTIFIFDVCFCFVWLE